MNADLVVIGAGAVGLGAARAARRRHASVILVEQARPGGDCTFTGCILSKSLLEVARGGGTFTEVMAAVHRAVEIVAASESPSALVWEGIDVVPGHARFVDRHVLDIGGKRVRAGAVVVATGAGRELGPVPHQ